MTIKTHRRIFSPACLVWIAAILAFGQMTSFAAPRDNKPAALHPAVAAAVDSQTLMVARVNFAKVDTTAIEKWARTQAEQSAPPADKEEVVASIAKATTEYGNWLAQFRQAGGKDIYLILGIEDVATGQLPVVIVPVQAGGAPDALKKLAPAGREARQLRDALVYASEEQWQTIDRARPLDRPDLAKALALAGDDTLAAGISLSSDSRRAIDELLPKLPAELGGGPATAITQGLQWASLSIQLPPEPALKLVIQSRDASSAGAMLELIKQVKLLFLSTLGRPVAHFPGVPATQSEAFHQAVSQVLESLTPRQQGDQLVTSVGSDDAGRLAGVLLAGRIQMERRMAMRIRSASNVRQLAIICQMWAMEKKNAWPDDLTAAAKDEVGDEQNVKELMENPSRPGTGYTYIKPTIAGLKNAGERIVLYEAEPTKLATNDAAVVDAGRNVGFADGHVEFLLEPDFQKKLRAQQDADQPAAK